MCQLFRIPKRDQTGFTPSSVRTGGATHLYLSAYPLDQISCALRHGDERSRWRYIQEAAAAFANAKLSPATRQLTAALELAVVPLLRLHALPRPDYYQ